MASTRRRTRCAPAPAAARRRPRIAPALLSPRSRRARADDPRAQPVTEKWLKELTPGHRKRTEAEIDGLKDDYTEEKRVFVRLPEGSKPGDVFDIAVIVDEVDLGRTVKYTMPKHPKRGHSRALESGLTPVHVNVTKPELKKIYEGHMSKLQARAPLHSDTRAARARLGAARALSPARSRTPPRSQPFPPAPPRRCTRRRWPT